MIVKTVEKEYRVYWRHENFSHLKHWKVNGSTQCLIESDGYGCGQGIAECSTKDNFNKSKGRIVSLTKAIKHLPKDVRKQFWNQYKTEIGF